MKIHQLSIALTIAIATISLSQNSVRAQATRFVDVIGNPPTSADVVNGVVGSGSKPGRADRATFAEGVQGRVNAASANLSVSTVSGSQSVAGNTVEVDATAAQTAIDVINSPVGSNPPAREALVVALGGGVPAQQLAQSMVGLRGADGSIDPVILNGAVSAYNNYIRSYISSSQLTERSSSELNSVLQSLPPGQKAAQVILGRLVEAAR